MVSIAGRRQVLRSQLDSVQGSTKRRRAEEVGVRWQQARIEATYRRFVEQEKVLREQLAELRREFRKGHHGICRRRDGMGRGVEFDAESDDGYTSTEVISDSGEGSRTPPAHAQVYLLFDVSILGANFTSGHHTLVRPQFS
jgi:hypothetical protein